MRRVALLLFLAGCGRSELVDLDVVSEAPTELEVVLEGGVNELGVGGAFDVGPRGLVARYIAAEGVRFVQLGRSEIGWAVEREHFADTGNGGPLAWGGRTVASGAPGGASSPEVLTFDDFSAPDVVLAAAPASPQFGRALAFSGDRLAVGDPGLDVGRVHIYARSSAGWNRLHTIEDEAQSFGSALDWSSTTLVVGAPSERTVVLFDEGFETIARVEGPLTAGGFGTSVAFDGRTLVVGAPSDGGLSGEGAVYTYAVGADVRAEQVLRREGGQMFAAFGYRVSLLDGRLVASAPGAANDAGEVLVFEHAESWRVTHSLASPHAGARLGAQIDQDADGIYVGAPRVSDAATLAGVLYFVRMSPL